MDYRKYFTVAITLVLSWVVSGSGSQWALAQETIRYSCSNQVFRAFEAEKIALFEKVTGIKVDVYRASSRSSAIRLMSGYADIASTARDLYPRHLDFGFYQVAFCRDPLTIITKKACGLQDLTVLQLVALFSGSIDNWKEIGGPDLPVMVIAPDRDTAANKNFRRFFMKHKDIREDFVTRDSTMVIEAVRYFPCGAVSFTSGGAAVKYPDLTMIKIDTIGPREPAYPYYQTFNYITRGRPSPAVKKFIDFNFSAQGRALIEKNGMIPLNR